jgi:hypothetical protein|tara:strand:- start:1123 stop:1800 length:678 start_codon:yes stop_codon:yes gene_type:complete
MGETHFKLPLEYVVADFILYENLNVDITLQEKKMLYSTIHLSQSENGDIKEKSPFTYIEKGDYTDDCHKYHSCIEHNNEELKRAWKLYKDINRKNFSATSPKIESLLSYLESVMAIYETWFKKYDFQDQLQLNRLIHSSDYRSVSLRGRKYNLSESQSLVIKYLYENFLQGTPQLSTDSIINNLNNERSTFTTRTRLIDVFKKNKEAYNALIKPGTINGTRIINI